MSTPESVLIDYPARYLAAWSDHHIDSAVDVVADKVEWIDPVLPEPLTSQEEARGFFEAAWGAFPDIRFEAVGRPMVDLANACVSQEWVMRGTHLGGGFPPGVAASGHTFEVHGCDVWQVDADGRAVSVHAYYDASDLMRQLGLA